MKTIFIFQFSIFNQFCYLAKKQVFKKFIVFFIIAVLQLSSFPGYTFAQSISMPSITESLINSLNPSATDSADQNNPSLSFSEPQQFSANFKIIPPVFVLGLSKANFQAKEQIEVVIKNSVSKNFSISVENENDKNYILNATQVSVNGDTVFTIYPSADLKPGRYKVSVLDTNTNQVISVQEFTWGVLAINTNKSIYLSNEIAKIAIAVLDETGDMVCNAKVILDIASPYGLSTHLSTDDGSIRVNPDCRMHSFTLNPDYEAYYQTTDMGRYTVTLTAITSNGSYTTKDRFEVRSYVAFDIERDTATRIYPPDTYPVKLKIHANEAFKGKIVESVPSDFQITQLQENGVYGYLQESPILENISFEKNYGIPKLRLPFNDNYSVTLGFGQEINNSKDKDIYKKSGLDAHDGIDFALPEETPVFSVDSGKIILAQENWIYGTSVVIQHKWGRTYYGHLSKLGIEVGENVSSGTEIGLSGSTGLSTGPHLHFGLKPKESDIDNLYFGKIDPSFYLGIISEDPVLSVSNYPISSKVLIWNVEIEKEADFVIGYRYKAPNKSPNFYTIGPLQFMSSDIKIEKPAKFDLNINTFVLGIATESGILISTSSADLISTSSADLISTDSANLNIQTEDNQNEKDRVVFQEIRPWQIAVDAATAIIITTSYSDPCGLNCFTVPSNWNNNNNTIEVVGGGGNGAAAVANGRGGGGGGGGGYSKKSNVTLSGIVNLKVGVLGGGPLSTGDSYFCNSTSNCTTGATFGSAVISGSHGGGNASAATGGGGGSVTNAIGDTVYAGGSGGTASATALTPGAGGGGSGGPNGAGGIGANSATTASWGGSGGGGNGGRTTTGGYPGATATTITGGTGGNNYNNDVGSGGIGGSPGGSGTNGGGGGGGTGLTAAGTAGAGGTGSKGIEWSDLSWGTGGGGGGGGSNSRTPSGTRVGGAGGTPPANIGSGGGGGGSGFVTGGALGSGSNGFIIVTYTPDVLTLNKIMRHGKWFSGGVEQPFTF